MKAARRQPQEIRVLFVNVANTETGELLGDIHSSGRDVNDAWWILAGACARDAGRDFSAEDFTYDDWRAA